KLQKLSNQHQNMLQQKETLSKETLENQEKNYKQQIEQLKKSHQETLSQSKDQANSNLNKQLEELKQQHEQKLQKLNNQHQNMLQQKETLSKETLENQEKNYKQQIEQLKKSHQETLSQSKDQANSNLNKQLKELKQQHEQKLQKLSNQHQNMLQQKETLSKETLENQEKNYKQQIEQLKKSHQEALSQIKDQANSNLNKQLEELKQQHEQKLQKLNNQHQNMLQQKETSSKEALENQEKNYKQQIEQLKKSHQETLSQIKDQANSNLNSQLNKLNQKCKQQKKVLEGFNKLLFESFPVLSTENIEEFNHFAGALGLKDVKASMNTDKVSNSTKTWGINVNTKETERSLKDKNPKDYKSPFQNFKDQNRIDFEGFLPKKDNWEKVLHIGGSVTLEISQKNKMFQFLVSKPHKINRLLIKNFKGIEGKLLEAECLSEIHTLILQGDVNYEGLEKLSKKFPNISCFDLRNAVVKGNGKNLSEKRIVLVKDDGLNLKSVEKHFKKLNNYLVESLRIFNKDAYGPFLKRFPKPGESKEDFPTAAAFITNVRFIVGLPIRETPFLILVPRIGYCFPNMMQLNLTKCPELTLDSLKGLKHLKLKNLFLVDCPMLSYKRTATKNLVPKESAIDKLIGSKISYGYFKGTLTDKQFNTYSERLQKGKDIIHTVPHYIFKEGVQIIKNGSTHKKTVERCYHISFPLLITTLNQLFSHGCEMIDLMETPISVADTAMQEGVFTHIKELREETKKEVKIRYTSSESNKHVIYPPRKSNNASSSSSSSSSSRRN
ncbi:hypothetical protein, partial [Candidatus Neptunochlamydia vexilliferae]|uniref:hypothetical protein n=1 Tax=Candidatus Neptunichlamydia vexilliferae TaxID=1651774 RepID=UPI001E5E5433